MNILGFNFDFSDIVAVYFVIGILYTMINGIFRGLYKEDDMFLPMMHIQLWPIFILGLGSWLIARRARKIKERIDEKRGTGDTEQSLRT